jgi:hypothetical protein
VTLTKDDKLWYDGWYAWRRLGKPKGLRPSNAPRIIPPRVWAQYRQDEAARREREAKYRRAMRLLWWQRPAFAVAWTQRTPFEVCHHIAALGHEAVWVETRWQSPRAAQWREAANQYGLKLVVWQWANEVQDAERVIELFKADAFVANVEHTKAGGWDKYAADLRLKYPRMPLGVWTNFWGVGADNESAPGYDPERLAKPWVDNEWACITEAYLVNEQGPQPTLDPVNLHNVATKVLGFEMSIPAFGIYRTGPETYAKYRAGNGGPFAGYVWYLYEYEPGGA